MTNLGHLPSTPEVVRGTRAGSRSIEGQGDQWLVSRSRERQNYQQRVTDERAVAWPAHARMIGVAADQRGSVAPQANAADCGWASRLDDDSLLPPAAALRPTVGRR